MVNSIQIKNFKSVVDISLELGNFNILIGENGCGKSNILEAIAFGAAASADKLDFEFLGSRGIRVPNPEFMFSAFKNGTEKKKIEISFDVLDNTLQKIGYILSNDSNNPRKWINEPLDKMDYSKFNLLTAILFEKDFEEREKYLKDLIDDDGLIKSLEKLADNIKNLSQQKGKENIELFKTFIESNYLNNRILNDSISSFIIYSPEQSSLRKFEETTQIYPLGVKGEGLFQHLKELTAAKGNKKILKQIKDNLLLIDWYENFELPDNLLSNEFTLKIKDKYLYEKLQYFDQRSTNEGFLFLLFYTTLFISKLTPQFFAIDNIDASLNPKLCMELTKNLATLATKHKKQVIATTQNPAILDGLNLKDENQRLFVVSRNSSGHTRIERIHYNENRKMKLSEVWTKGFIGGLPSNF